jgi:hypothetical protein
LSGRCRRSCRPTIIYATGIASAAKAGDAARVLVKFIMAPNAAGGQEERHGPGIGQAM